MKSFDKKIKNSQNENRPEARPQHTATGYGHFRELQSLADNSPQSKQLMRTKSLIGKASKNQFLNNPPAQLKALAPGKLNVVGEDHDESKFRREDEKRIRTEHVGGGYWLENEFLLNDQRNCFSAIFSKRKFEYGDPINLRWKQFCAFFVEDCDRRYAWIKDFRKKGNFEITTYPLVLGDLRNSLKHYQQAEIEHSKLDTEDQSSDLHLNVGRLAARINEVLANNYPNDEEFWNNFGGYIGKIKTELNNKSAADIIGLRSEAMQKGAKSDSTQVGIWKIGETHIQQFAPDPDAKYQVLTQAEFNSQYQTDLEHHKRARITANGESKEIKPPPSST